MKLSLVVPVYNEAENLAALCSEIREALEPTGWTYEVVFVDDGSSDGSAELLARLHTDDPRRKVLYFRRNFGQTAALAAGFAYAHGEIIVSLDGDLQNDPADIVPLVAKLDEGYDLVNGWRYERQDPLFSRRLPSRIANWLISVLTQVRLHDYGCTLKAFRQDVAKGLSLYGEMHRFIPALASERGAKIAELRVSHRARRSGRSKYGLSRTLWVVLDLITLKFLSSYASRPSHLFGLIGLVSMFFGGALTVGLGIQRIFFSVRLAGRPLLLLGILLLVTGIQFLTMGLLGEMLARTYREGRERPLFLVKHVLE